MADEFNPYHVWLGIPLKDQPPNYYRLLSIDLFETSGDVIDSAADRQMAHLRTFQSGKHGELTQRLLNEVAAARVCLLDSQKRAAYDQQIKAKLPALAAAAAPTDTVPSAASGSATPRQPPRRLHPLATVAPAPNIQMASGLPQPANDWDDLLGDPAAKSASRSAGKPPGVSTAKASAAKRAARNRNMSIGIAAAVLLIAAAGIGWFALSGSSAEGTLVFDWPSEEKADATLTVDNVPLPAPATGPWEYHGSAGSHHVVALRPAYMLDANVVVSAGQRQPAPADWKPKAVLVLNWPLSQRNGAELKLDGRAHAVTQHEPLELAVEPGSHVVQITRPDVAPLTLSAAVSLGGRKLVAIAAPQPSTTKLVFDWPTDQRQDAELIIDGSKQTVPSGADSASFALVVAPGRRVVNITRAGFEPFKMEIDLAAGANEAVKPVWTRVQTVAATVPEATTAETRPAVETPTGQLPKKLPIPPAAEQEKVAKQLDDFYKSSHPGSKNPATAHELYDLAAKASPAERYVLLVKGAELAAVAGDLSLSLQGVDSLDDGFQIDALEARQKLLGKFVNAGKPNQVDAAIPIAEQLMDQAVGADRFALAIECSMIASRAATKSKIPTRKQIDERLSTRRHEIRLLEPLFAAAKTAQETLAKNPTDAGANLNSGRWLCFYKGDWADGLPLLAKGSDEKLKPVAEQELKHSTDGERQAYVADAWWELALKESGIAHDSLRLHAGDIYQMALPNLTSTLRKAAIEKRLAEIASLRKAVVSTAMSDGTRGPRAQDMAPLNRWVELLPLVDTTRDVVSGKWSRKGEKLEVARYGVARLMLPVAVAGGYDLDAAFSRLNGIGEIRIRIPVGASACDVEWGMGGKVSALDVVSGWRVSDDGNPTKVFSPDIENGRVCHLGIQVRLLSSDRATVDVSLDGKPFLPHWEGDPSALSVVDAWTMPKLDHLGLGVWDSQAAFTAVRLRRVSGHASLDTAVGEAESPTWQTSPVPAISKKPPGSMKFPLNQSVDVLRLIDIARDGVVGNWTAKGTELAVASGTGTRIVVPVVVDGGYDFDAEFTRTMGTDSINFILPVGSHACMAVLGGWKGGASGLMDVDGRDAMNPGNPIAVRPGPIETGHRYRASVRVRILSKDRASVDVWLDGKPYLPHWEGNPASLINNTYWALPNPNRLGLAAQESDVTFHSALLRTLSGLASANSALQQQGADGAISFLARDAICHGEHIQVERLEQGGNIGVWGDPTATVEWKFIASKPGAYTVIGEIAAPNGGKFTVASGDRSLEATAPSTGSYEAYQRATLGQIKISSTGATSLIVKPIKDGWLPMNLKSIVLEPSK